MKWFHRLCNLPMLIALHFRHTVQFTRIGRAQRDLYWACDKWEQETDHHIHAMFAKSLEKELEKMADIDSRMSKLWHRR